jgi:hypothetical protein
LEVLSKKDKLLGDIVEKIVDGGDNSVPQEMWKKAIESGKKNSIDYNIAYDIAEAIENSKSATPYQGIPGFGGFDPALNKANVIHYKLKKELGIDIQDIMKRRVVETYVSKDAKIKDIGYIKEKYNPKTDESISTKEQLDKATESVRREGYDGVKFQTDESIGNTEEIAIWNMEKIKTQEQVKAGDKRL